LDLDLHRRLPLLPGPFFIALRILREPAIELSSIKTTRSESFVPLEPINCFFENINVPENVSNSLVTLRVKDTTHGISNQLEFIQERIPAVVVYVLHVGLWPTAIFGR
jgi:hypothetical protein